MRTQSLSVVGVATMVAAVVGTGAAPVGTALGSVSGQVVIQERPGEVTEDIQNVVVFLEPTGATTSRAPRLPTTNTTVALQSRQFSPRVRVITQGSTIEFPNQDPFSHNVFSKTNGGFDTGVYGRGKMKDQTFKDAGVYPIYCNVHPRMTAFIITLATPYFTQAGNDGRFSLDNVPAGDYKMTVWHDRATAETRSVTVGDAVAPMRIELDARGYKYVQHKDKTGKEYKNAKGDRY